MEALTQLEMWWVRAGGLQGANEAKTRQMGKAGARSQGLDGHGQNFEFSVNLMEHTLEDSAVSDVI